VGSQPQRVERLRPDAVVVRIFATRFVHNARRYEPLTGAVQNVIS
jgi:hypothetical protein